MTSLRPSDPMFDQADLRCVVCNTPMRTGCGCHTKCRCGWLVRKTETCRNPTHAREEAAQEVARLIAGNVLDYMRQMYPEPMKYASGSFAKTLGAVIHGEATGKVLAILNMAPDAGESEACR